MILGIGIDLLHVPRMRALLTRHKPLALAQRILAGEELQDFKTRFPAHAASDTAAGESKATLQKLLTDDAQDGNAPLPDANLLSWRSTADVERWNRRRPAAADDLDPVARYLGVSWCVKEAAYKALNPSWEIQWKDMILRRDATGKPSLATSEEILLNCSITSSHVSVSHDGDYIVAQVLFETDQEQREPVVADAPAAPAGST